MICIFNRNFENKLAFVLQFLLVCRCVEFLQHFVRDCLCSQPKVNLTEKHLAFALVRSAAHSEHNAIKQNVDQTPPAPALGSVVVSSIARSDLCIDDS